MPSWSIQEGIKECPEIQNEEEMEIQSRKTAHKAVALGENPDDSTKERIGELEDRLWRNYLE